MISRLIIGNIFIYWALRELFLEGEVEGEEEALSPLEELVEPPDNLSLRLINLARAPDMTERARL